MTMFDDTGKLTPGSREALLAERAKIEKDILFLKGQPLAKSEAGRRMDQQAMLDLARKMVNIDKKLGRA